MYVDRETDRIWFTPSDLTSYLASPWVFAQRVAAQYGERKPWPRPEATTAEIAAKLGDEHELAHLRKLESRGLKIAKIDKAQTLEQWETAVAATTAALADPSIDVIFQAHLYSAPGSAGQWRGQADFLERDDQGNWVPVDTKLARSVKPYMILQLCIYADALGEVSGSLPEQFHIELGNGERASFRTADHIDYARRAQARLEQYVVDGRFRDEYPWPSDALEESGLIDEARAIWEADDHLSQVAGVSRKQFDRLRAAGINTMAELAELADDATVDGISEKTLTRLRNQAELQKRDEPGFLLLPPREGRGLACMPKPSPGDLYYDIEGDPLWSNDGGLEYLHGLWWRDGEAENFEAIWAHDRDEERLAVERVIDTIVARRAEDPNMHVFHYAPYEVTALKRLTSTHGTREQELDDLLRGEVFVDLYKVVNQSLQASVPNYSIKSMERFYMEEREGDVKEGGSSIVVYENWRPLAGTPEGDELLESIRAYNEVDCRSTWLLHEWLRHRKREMIRQFGWVGDEGPVKVSEDAGNVTPMSGQQSDVQILEMRIRAVSEPLEKLAAETADPDRARGLDLLAKLLWFVRRESRASWWSHYAHMEMDHNALMDDVDSIAGLEPIGADPENPNAFLYSFPEQDTKLRAGKVVKAADTGMGAGSILSLDEQKRIVGIRNDGSRPSGIYAFEYVGADAIANALIDFGERILSGADGPRRTVTEKLLMLHPPLFGERLSGETLEELRQLLDDLEGSYLVAQGPPGTGKTYTAADLIVDQLRNGRRVGVTAFSHAAVNNLLDAVEERADELGVSFSGVKKDASGKPRYESRFGSVESSTSGKSSIFDTADLVGGTAWHFSDPSQLGRFDLLVIDEAGQMSLAYALAASTAAETLLMVGDPNQLPQVTKADHPGDSGASALEHVLGDLRTMPAELGIFLPRSRRMTPDLCEFVGETFYESRLHPHDDAQDVLPPEGFAALQLVPVAHSGNRHGSVEEAAAIPALIERLEDAGIVREKVMVVSPFNMQVEIVQEQLHEAFGAENAIQVLTVDKCQGQEADAVIFTTATSGGEEIPRGLDFLFSANRFNVAISRGRRTAFLVCDPALLDIACNTVQQIRLVNAFAAFERRAAELGRSALAGGRQPQR